jgi:hypothetical protein
VELFHYDSEEFWFRDGHLLLRADPGCAAALAKYRINPGNVGFGKKKDAQFGAIIEKAIEYGKPVRIGANWGSLDQSMVAMLMDENAQRAQPWDASHVAREALIRSALDSAALAEKIGLPRERIILSAKVSGVQELIAVYRDLAARGNYALHLGLTEAGRKRQLAMIVARVRKMVPDDAPLILAGDFNDWQMRACHYFKDELGLAEVFETHHGKPARSYPSILPMFQLDRIYVRRFTIQAAQVHTGNAWHRISDHAALTAKLSPA